jgi:predicted metal-dependent RNase
MTRQVANVFVRDKRVRATLRTVIGRTLHRKTWEKNKLIWITALGEMRVETGNLGGQKIHWEVTLRSF